MRDIYKIFAPRTVAVQDGEISVKQAAAELGIPADAIYNWLRHGQVPARRGPSRALVHPLGPRHPGDLPAEGRQVLPPQANQATGVKARRPTGSAGTNRSDSHAMGTCGCCRVSAPA